MTDPYCSSCHELLTEKYPVPTPDGNKRYVCKDCYEDIQEQFGVGACWYTVNINKGQKNDIRKLYWY